MEKKYLPPFLFGNFTFFRYIEWSSHEPSPGEYDFTGDNNITEFIKIAQEEDLMVIVRVGPFIDAERDMVNTNHSNHSKQ